MSLLSPVLDMDLPARQASWRFDLVTPELTVLGELEVDRDSPPQLSVDTSRSVKRTLTGVRLPPNVINEVDVVKDRVKLTMVLNDGSEWPQGVFLFSDVSRLVVTQGLDIGLLSLVDQLLIVDQQTTRSISYEPSKQITVAIGELLAELPIAFTVVPAGAVITPSAEAISWPAGTSRLRIINELATMIGYHELFFDNTGRGQLALMPNPEEALESIVLMYPLGGRTYLGSTTRSTNLLELPNRFMVLNNGAGDIPISAIYDVPASAPHSFANRGFYIAHVEQLQGIATVSDAQSAAQSLARLWKFPFETVEFSSPPDPRHDTYNVVDFEGVRFLELSWSMSLVDGSEMRHVLRRTYEAQTAEPTA